MIDIKKASIISIVLVAILSVAIMTVPLTVHAAWKDNSGDLGGDSSSDVLVGVLVVVGVVAAIYYFKNKNNSDQESVTTSISSFNDRSKFKKSRISVKPFIRPFSQNDNYIGVFHDEHDRPKNLSFKNSPLMMGVSIEF